MEEKKVINKYERRLSSFIDDSKTAFKNHLKFLFQDIKREFPNEFLKIRISAYDSYIDCVSSKNPSKEFQFLIESLVQSLKTIDNYHFMIGTFHESFSKDIEICLLDNDILVVEIEPEEEQEKE